MNMFRGFLAVMLSVFSTSVMSYISMAVPIGPWIETTLVLVAMIIINIYSKVISVKSETDTLSLATAAGGIGGILATGFGFSLPMLFFIDKNIFNVWLASPIYFSLILGTLAFSAGALGLLVAELFEFKLINQSKLEFPIGSLVYKMISVQGQLANAMQLAVGFIVTQFMLFVKAVFGWIPNSINLLRRVNYSIFSVPALSIDLEVFPMLLSIGFITGHLIAVPLAVGLMVKYIFLDPFYNIYSSSNVFSVIIAPGMNSLDFMVAFSTGIVVYGTLIGFAGFPRFIRAVKKSLFSSNDKLNRFENSEDDYISDGSYNKDSSYFDFFNIKNAPVYQIAVAAISSIIFLSYFNFSILSQLYLIVFTFICAYQLSEIAGKIGLAPLGRFATFVMVPGMLIFGYNPIQVTIVSVFVEVAGGVACDALFGRKLAQLAGVEKKKIVFYQWLGLVTSALFIGLIFWILIVQFGIGPELGLPVQKAWSRSLLINMNSFNWIVMIVGAVVGAIISRLGVNPVLMLGGLLMPINFSIILIAGGLSANLVKNKEQFYPFFSGVFAANSLWMIIRAFIA